jgi:hypothetical protein
VSGAYGAEIGRNLSAGITLKFIRSNLADVGAGAAAGEAVALQAVLPMVGGAFAFAACGVLLAAAIVQSRDY